MKSKKQKNKNLKQGFTLLELLVVVLIIGILAAIALPQYKMVVAKSQFTELKTITKNLAGAVQRYYMINGTYKFNAKDLDLDFDIKSSDNESWFKTKNEINCYTWWNSNIHLSCGKKILGTRISLYVDKNTGKPIYCLPWSKDTTDLANRLCQQETNRKTPNHCDKEEENCTYTY